MSTLTGEFLIARNPADGGELGRVPATAPEDVAGIVARAREAQGRWGDLPWRERRKYLKRWWGLLARDADAWADLIRAEIGKPRVEALASDVLSTLDALRWTVRNAGRALADERIGPGCQRWLFIPPGQLRWRPVGVVGMIGTWNYPLFLNAPPIAQALAAGNAVVWKPSELAPLCGDRLARSLEEAGFPPGLVATIPGGGAVGRALVEAGMYKGMFTGGIATGRAVLEALGRQGIPALAELSGFDPALVLPDAPLASTVPALLWGAFVGCGQTCVAVKRVLVVGDPVPWAEALARQAGRLRVGDPASAAVDIGPMISREARDRFEAQVGRAVEVGARLLAGGQALPGPGWFVAPAVLSADGPAPEEALAGVFGPVVLVRGFRDVDAAVEAANASGFALAASVWGLDRRAAARVARRLQAGSVAVNEAVTPTAHAAAPFGGMKASGYGRTKGAAGLREFAQPQVLHVRRPGGFRPHLFPYATWIERPLRLYRKLFHPADER